MDARDSLSNRLNDVKFDAIKRQICSRAMSCMSWNINKYDLSNGRGLQRSEGNVTVIRAQKSRSWTNLVTRAFE
jgi:hypothetical protein